MRRAGATCGTTTQMLAARAKIVPVNCRKTSACSANLRSNSDKSAENRDIIRPDGVSSNQEVGACITLSRHSPCNFCPASAAPSFTAKEHPNINANNKKVPSAYTAAYKGEFTSDPPASNSSSTFTHSANQRSVPARVAYAATQQITAAPHHQGPIAPRYADITDAAMVPVCLTSAFTSFPLLCLPPFTGVSSSAACALGAELPPASDCSSSLRLP
mmetsp:Transcript_63107/g.169209  ORF Transcript_63107/g.169209 Transcript_63107/m.169209 type:complete len:216 (-) Transcript_63107:1229-1876(-)